MVWGQGVQAVDTGFLGVREVCGVCGSVWCGMWQCVVWYVAVCVLCRERSGGGTKRMHPRAGCRCSTCVEELLWCVMHAVALWRVACMCRQSCDGWPSRAPTTDH